MVDHAPPQRVIAGRQCYPIDKLLCLCYIMMSAGRASRLQRTNGSQHPLEISRAGWTCANLFVAWPTHTEHFTLRHCDIDRTGLVNGPLKLATDNSVGY